MMNPANCLFTKSGMCLNDCNICGHSQVYFYLHLNRSVVFCFVECNDQISFVAWILFECIFNELLTCIPVISLLETLDVFPLVTVIN